jgi:hypothetical protein
VASLRLLAPSGPGLGFDPDEKFGRLSPSQGIFSALQLGTTRPCRRMVERRRRRPALSVELLITS